jgi:hypothetical protein
MMILNYRKKRAGAVYLIIYISGAPMQHLRSVLEMLGYIVLVMLITPWYSMHLVLSV